MSRCCAAVMLLLLPWTVLAWPSDAGELWVYIGTGTSAPGQGIYRVLFDPKSGQFASQVELAAESKHASFLAVHPNRRFIYAVREDYPRGVVRAYAVKEEPGVAPLQLLNEQPAGGAGPCHISLDPAGRFALVANYGDGTAAVLPIETNGQLGPPCSTVQHTGSGPNQQRQDKAHAHAINLDAAGKFAFVSDLGLDEIRIYRFLDGKLTPNDPDRVKLAPGAGPRHFAWHPSGKFAFSINELNSTLTVLAYDPASGALQIGQTLSTLPAGYPGRNSTAEVVVHPNGQWVFGSNRGHNSIASFRFDSAQGELVLVGHQNQDVKTPRNFVLDPTGNYLLVANQDSNSVVLFRLDVATGLLTPTQSKVIVPRPMCLRFWRK